jgi:hypothetical protein
MHLVRIHAKPRVQHGSLSVPDQADPAAVAIRRAHGLHTSSGPSTRLKNPIWKYLPFADRVSNLKTNTLSVIF